MARYRDRFWDVTGARFGLPSFPWRCAPDGLATRRQLRSAGLAPGGRDPVAQVLWVGTGGVRAAYLYDASHAVAKRTATPAQLAALGKALTARRTCTTCGLVRDYTIPASLGECLTCADAYPVAEAA